MQKLIYIWERSYMEQIIILNISFQFNGTEDTIYPVVLLDGKETILIDCGYIGSLSKIETALLENGINPSSLTKVVITHHDHDHMGSLYDLKERYPHIQIFASKTEADYIGGKSKSLRLEQVEAAQNYLPEKQKAIVEQFINILRKVKTVSVDVALQDGDIMDWCGGCEIISTPGHMPGHISLYLPKHKTVIAGDAIALENGKPVIANPQFALDKETALLSLDKLLNLEADRIICYHGGIYAQ